MTETVVNVCGFCITGHHRNCRKPIAYYEKTWTCECPHDEREVRP